MSNPFAVASVQNRREIAHPRVLAKGKDDRRITEQTVLPQGLRISYIELVLVKRLNENGHSAAAISILWPRGGVGCLLTLLGLWYLGILVVRSSFLKYIKINLGKHIIRMVLFCKLSVYHAEDICHADWALLLLL